MSGNQDRRGWLGALAGGLLGLLSVVSAPAAEPASGPAEGVQAGKAEPKEVLATTHHEIAIAGETVRYTATAGNYLLRDEDGTAKASFFFVAYTRDGVRDLAKRPLLFAFNGGPGSSSVWLHLGLLGPRRADMGTEGWAPAPPYRLVDNAASLLDVTDLVFIDPVTTGYSRAVPGEKAKDFHGYREDIESVGALIRLWVTRNQRWASPKFLAGESYGTVRASGLAEHLQSRYGMYLNGVILISAVLNFGTIRFEPGNDLPYALYLPTYTATAWYHHRLPADLASDLGAAVEESRRFALGEYSRALLLGARLPADERARVVAQLARLTGLSPAYVEATDLRIQISRFVKELLRGDARTVGRLDARFRGIDRDAAGERNEYDPSMEAIRGPYGTLLNDYVRRELGFENELPYELLTSRVSPWSYKDDQNRFLYVGEALRQAITRNPALKVFVANGYYDLATPFFATEYCVAHLGLDPSLTGNVQLGFYEAGHMMYIHQASLARLRADLGAFVAAATAER